MKPSLETQAPPDLIGTIIAPITASYHKMLVDWITVCPAPKSNYTGHAHALLRQGQWYCVTNEMELAARSFLAILQEDPNNAHAKYCIGCILHIAGIDRGEAQAIAHAVQVFIDGSTHPEVSGVSNFQLGLIFERFGGPSPTELFSSAAQQLPNCADVQIKYSHYAFWQARDITLGVQAFERALQLRPDWLEAYDLTNFDGSYVEGIDKDPRVIEHLELRKKRIQARRRALKIDQIPFRVLRGVDTNLGHYVWFDDIARLQMLGWINPYQYMVLPEKKVVNPALMQYWSRYFSINESKETYQILKPLLPFLELNLEADLLVPEREFSENYYKVINLAQEQWERESRPPPLKLSDEHHEKGWKALQGCGLPPGAWFVALHVRDDGFLGPNASQSVRNSNIENFMDAVRSITARGGWVIRMGDPKMAPMPSAPNVIDYARSDIRSDWMDIFLFASCRFFMGTHSGPIWIPKSFGVPTIAVDWVPLTRMPWTGNAMVVPKWFRNKRTKEMLPLHEIIDPQGKVGWGWSESALERAELEVVANTPEEILEAVCEMFERIEGTLKLSDHDQFLQKKFQAVVIAASARGHQGDRTALVPRHFLHKHRALFT